MTVSPDWIAEAAWAGVITLSAKLVVQSKGSVMGRDRTLRLGRSPYICDGYDRLGRDLEGPDMSVTDEIGLWLDENWDPQRSVGDWWDILAESGWGYPSWPKKWFGRGLGAREAGEARSEMARRGVLGPPTGASTFLAAPTIFSHGTQDQIARFLPGIARGTQTWCQLFSEPGSGSDLASLSTKAERDGDEFIINGQKVWNSGAQFSDLAILVARTDSDQPKHRGITYFIFDMRQPGVEVRPLVEMTGGETFNEVFLTDARVPVDCQLGDLNQGWRVIMTTLSHERDNENPANSGGGSSFIGRPDLAVSCTEAMKPVQDKPLDGLELSMSGNMSEMPRRLAEEFDKTEDPVTRQELMGIHTQRAVMRFNGLRATARRTLGQEPGAESSTGKIQASDIGRLIRDVGSRIEGPYGQLMGEDAPHEGRLQIYGLFVPAASIAGGTDEIQRNIIGERVLGLPKEPDISRDVAHRDLQVSTQRD